MNRLTVFICLFQLCFIDLTLGCQRAQLGDPDCTSCEEDLDQFNRDIKEIEGIPPAIHSAPIIYSYRTRGDGCMVASSVCNPNGNPTHATAFIIAFTDELEKITEKNSFTSSTLGPSPTKNSEYRCQKGEWYSVQKANPAKKGLVKAVLCYTAPPPPPGK